MLHMQCPEINTDTLVSAEYIDISLAAELGDKFAWIQCDKDQTNYIFSNKGGQFFDVLIYCTKGNPKLVEPFTGVYYNRPKIKRLNKHWYIHRDNEYKH